MQSTEAAKGFGQPIKDFFTTGSISGLFGLPSRTPIKGLWLCGDSIHPGEGTAGVSQSALMVWLHLLANRGLSMNVDQ